MRSPPGNPLRLDGFDPLPEVVFSDKLKASFRTALGDTAGTATLNVSDEVGLTASTDPDIYSDATRKLEVPVVTLDSLREEIIAAVGNTVRPGWNGYCYVLKLDVDGHEHLVLRGARNILRKTTVVIAECMNDHYCELVEAELAAAEQERAAGPNVVTYLWKRHKVGNIDYVYTREAECYEDCEVLADSGGTVDGVLKAFDRLTSGA